MSTCSLPKSNLDASCPEYIPERELRSQLRGECHDRLEKIIEPIFCGDGKVFRAQLEKAALYLFGFKSQANKASLLATFAPCFMGEIIAELSVSSTERSTVGFRFFRELRALLPVKAGQELENGFISHLHRQTESFLCDAALKQIMLHSKRSGTPTSSPSPCEEAGDIPNKIPSVPIEGVFSLTSLLNLLITRLNLPDTPDITVCVPPAKPCLDLCKFVDAACRIQATCDRDRSSAMLDNRSHPEGRDEISDMKALMQKDWHSLLYQLLDSFSQCLGFFSSLFASLNLRVLSGAWHRSASIEDRTNVQSASPNYGDNDFDIGSSLPALLNSALTCMRELLLDECLPHKLLRSTVLDILMYATELAAISNVTYPTWNEPIEEEAGVDGGSVESENDEVYESFEKFLKETNQLP
ncbi:unnamed protein product [Calicophoron daubneyi]|uniref:Uncharacterized protein n=1 Tax=Calicophoron daubneyi TaxID=300641 RepID=A0AAV2TS56_CALDB